MSDGVRISISGVAQCEAAFKSRSTDIIDAVKAALSDSGDRVARGANARAPRLSGRLATSYAKETYNDGLTVTVKTDVPYAPFVELGTGMRGSATSQEHPDDYSYGSKPGMPAQPHLWPAAMEEESTLLSNLDKAIAPLL